MRTSALAGIAAVALVLGPGAAVATAGLWSAPANLGDVGGSAPGNPVYSDAAIDANGTALVAWTFSDGPLRAALRPPDGVFGATETLATDHVSGPATALDGSGGAIVAWSRNGSLGLAERTAERPALAPVPSAIGGVAGAPDVAFLAPRRALIVWAGTDGAVHAVVHMIGGGNTALADITSGPGDSGPQVDAVDGRAVAAWTNQTADANNQTTTRIRAAAMPAGGTFGPAEEVASAVSFFDPGTGAPEGANLGLREVTASGANAADVLIGGLGFQGQPGDFYLTSSVATRTGAGWGQPQGFASADGPTAGFADDIATAHDGSALYVAAERPPTNVTTFFANGRAPGAAAYGDRIGLDSGAEGDILAAGLTPGRYLVLLRNGSSLRSRAGGASGFAAPLTFSGTDSMRLLALGGSPNGLAAAAWITTAGKVHAAIYDDSLSPTSLPPPAARDRVAPVLSGLSVSPRRFAVRRPTARTATARGTRIRWRLSEPARVTLRIERARPGLRRGGRCVARRPRSGPVRRCTRYVRVGSLARSAKAGATSLRFNGSLRGHGLRPGRYRLTASARDAAGNRGRAKHAAFTVVRR